MVSLSTRRWLSIALATTLGAALLFAHSVLSIALLDPSMYSGWTLLGMMFALALFNTRKKLLPLPLGTSAMWLQLHIYLGFLSVVVFVLHTGWRLPSGQLETVLFALYVFVAGTGLVGLALSRLIPIRLARHEQEIIFERIPIFRKQLSEEAREIALKSIEGGSTIIADFYHEQLVRFFSDPRNVFAHFVGAHRVRHTIIPELRALRRYLTEADIEKLTRLEDIVLTKNGLDFQYANQAALKVWLFLHIPPTYALLIFSVLHVVVVYAYSGAFS